LEEAGQDPLINYPWIWPNGSPTQRVGGKILGQGQNRGTADGWEIGGKNGKSLATNSKLIAINLKLLQSINWSVLKLPPNAFYHARHIFRGVAAGNVRLGRGAVWLHFLAPWCLHFWSCL
jgi:hypothetical protein